MKIAVVNGSPRGENSITLQTLLYLEKKYPQHSFSFIPAAARIKALEKDFSPAAEILAEAELIIFSYPVYTFLVPSQLVRFLELLKASGLSLRGKYATQFSTSKHFYDVTAHRYIQENCADLGLSYVKGLSADMDDLTKPAGQKDAVAFLEHVLWEIEQGLCETPKLAGTGFTPLAASPAPAADKLPGKKLAVVADYGENDAALVSMLERFCSAFPYETRLINLREREVKGGCLGCLNCTANGVCVYRDGFSEMLREEIQSCDGIVYAFTIRDHGMGSRMKQYDDRQFCNGHRTVTMGSPVGYLISGNYAAEENLRMVLEARAETGGNYFAGVGRNDENPDASIDALVKRLSYALENGYCPPKNFYGVGGMRIFRDLIYLMQGMMRADHKFFKAHGQYDFPQKQPGTILLMYLAGAMFSNDKLRKKLGGKINEGMLAPYKKVLEDA